ncbi:hypothetical protein L228DRAFT_246625 [Xylona heveae TC161]|uniref:Uncharacterized protein n=1 Tax=Xylona heveae (strain CBS 132557 / TC161) TaxID=1328760 RepID=A0A165HNN4_XYLHT|nr:hypothetical protein L228DRAFT_246625 [Xylona heveae TC161]KZF23779.1 hypothetical protein L228DRAFT_246625 [Xylona heveae TC161]
MSFELEPNLPLVSVASPYSRYRYPHVSSNSNSHQGGSRHPELLHGKKGTFLLVLMYYHGMELTINLLV